MENPLLDIKSLIPVLCQSPPSTQARAIDKYFTRDAEFVHPFCRVWSTDHSRWAIHRIFEWYKIMSPSIDLQIHSVAFDEQNLKLYVNLTQVFRIWVLPSSDVTLTTVLDLTNNPGPGQPVANGNRPLYYIKKQEDLYQTTDFIKFVLPKVGHLFVAFWHVVATLFCIVLAFLFAPIVWAEERGWLPVSKENVLDPSKGLVPGAKNQ